MTFSFNAGLKRVAIAALNVRARLTGAPPVLDPNDPRFIADPYPFYRALRERDPVHLHPLGIWLASRHADAVTVWNDPRFAHPEYNKEVPPGDDKSDPMAMPRGNLFVSQNPPNHTRLRKIFTDILTRRFFESWRPRIEHLTAELLASAAAKGRMDLIADLARPLPLTIISEIMGLPAEDRTMLMNWSNAVIHAMGVVPTPEERALGSKAAANFNAYFQIKLDERRREQGSDVISSLVRAQAQDPEFTDEEILNNCALLFSAGHETSVAMIGSGMELLLRNGDQLAKLRANPALIGKAIDEILRYEPPVQLIGRMAMEDVVMDGKLIQKGQTVYILIGAVNRDPKQFSNPERFDIERSENSHLTFGHGIHACIGQFLARTEGAVAISALIEKFPNLRLESQKADWIPLAGNRALQSVNVLLN